MSDNQPSPSRYALRSAWLYFATGVATVVAWNSPLGAVPRKMAGQAIAVAEFDLATMYFNGDALDKDSKRAAHWYRLAARRGNTDAALQLSQMYAAGDGVPVNARLAQQWGEFANHPEGRPVLNSTSAGARLGAPVVSGGRSLSVAGESTDDGPLNAEPTRNEIPPMDLGSAAAIAEDAENQDREFRRIQEEEERVRLQNQEFADQARERDRMRIEAEDRQREENSRMIEEQNNAAQSSYGAGQSTSNE